MKLRLALAALVLFSFQTVFAGSQPTPHPGQVQDDQSLLTAIAGRKQVYYVEAGDLQVTKVLPEDTVGLPHQLWMAKTPTGETVEVVYNTDMGQHIPIQVGDTFSVGGQFLWVETGAMIHWTHIDPEHKRPDGYVYLNGVVYGTGGNGN